jgi:UDP-glucuronate decarboxylase
MHPKDGRVVSNFIVQALMGEPITIYGDGTQTRSFCFVDDLISGLKKFMNSGDDIVGPINLGNPSEITIKTLAEKILDMTNSSSRLIFKELPSNDPIRRKPDITMAQSLLNWEPDVSLEDGLVKTIDYFHEKLKSNF